MLYIFEQTNEAHRKNMKEQLYRVEGTLIRQFFAGKRNPMISTGAIKGETEANNWRKYLSTSFPEMYFRMVPIAENDVRYYQASFDNIIASELKKQNS